MSISCTRRSFLAQSAAWLGAGSAPLAWGMDSSPTPRSRPPQRPTPARKRVALITTIYRYLSHSYHIAGRFLYGYMKDGQHHFPDFAIASAYVDQVGDNDLSRELAQRHGFRISPTVEDALTLGTRSLAVDAVLLIAEQGTYPFNDKRQELYPRYEWFQRIAQVMKDSGRTVPVFNDKHLSYDRRKAQEMVATAKRLQIPLMAGSSLPVTYRRPELELPLGAKIREAVVASRGEFERYGIHALEALQAMLERRHKGEAQQGVRAVTCLKGDAVFEAGDKGLWSWELLEHALGRSESRNVGEVRENCRHFPLPSLWGSGLRGPHAILIEYRDGVKAAVLQLDGHVGDETFAARIDGQQVPASTLFYLPIPPGAAFLEAQTRHIEAFFTTGQPPYPVERTLLTSSILDYAFESRFRNSARIETPDLDIRYAAPDDSGFIRGSYASPVK